MQTEKYTQTYTFDVMGNSWKLMSEQFDKTLSFMLLSLTVQWLQLQFAFFLDSIHNVIFFPLMTNHT